MQHARILSQREIDRILKALARIGTILEPALNGPAPIAKRARKKRSPKPATAPADA